jgi:peptidylprolyl isomerase
MKTIFPVSALLVASIALVQNAASQTPAPAKPHPAPVVKSAAPAAKPAEPTPAGCVKLPAISPKVPALPPGSPCAKPLYTIISNPPFKLTDISPMEDSGLREAIGIQLPETITLSYIDTKVGTGALVVPRKWYTIKYTGYLTDGTKFDTSDNHPENGGTFSFQQGPNAQNQRQVVLGMDTGLDGMRIGGKRRLIIPWELAYGPTAHLSIPPKSDLIFDIELVKQSDTDPNPKPAPAASTPAAAPASSTAPAAAPAPAVTTPPQPAAPKP